MKNSIITIFSALSLLGCGKTQPVPPPAGVTYSVPKAIPVFDGQEAMALLERQTSFGPRVPGTPAHAKCLDFMLAHLDSLGWSNSVQSFTMPGYDGNVIDFHNVIARLRPESPWRVLLAAHWDTRPFADMESDPRLHSTPIPGANDGASGVAVLLHLASIFAEFPPDIGIDIILFDGEDLGREGDESMFCLGSKYYSATLGDDPRPIFGVLLDLVGDKEAEFPREGFSERYAADILDLFWGRASALGLPQFVNRRHAPIIDDHVPLNTVAGIRTIAIIDASLVGHVTEIERRKYWHTLRDTPEQCSPSTLEAVGSLLMHVIYGMQPPDKT